MRRCSVFEALREIGRVLVSQGVEFPIEEVRVKRGAKNAAASAQAQRKNQKVGVKRDAENPLLVKIIFDLDTGKLDCDCDIRCDDKRAEEYLWVGNARGQKPQLRLTTDSREYLLDPSEGNKWAINAILKEIESEGLHKDPDIGELRDTLARIREGFFGKDGGGSQLSAFESVASEEGCILQYAALYTVAVRQRGEVIDLVKTPGYRKFLRYALYERGERRRGRCHVCGREGEVLADPAYPEGSILCIYNVDKAGFMPDLDRGKSQRAHAVCPSCKTELTVGLRYVEKNLASNIGKLSVYLIPRIVGAEVSRDTLTNISREVKDAFSVVKTLEGLRNVEETLNKLRGIKEYEGLYFLDILFGSAEQSHFAYQYYIQDVPVMRLVELAEVLREFSNKVAGVFGEDAGRWSVGFEDIYRIFPLKVTEGRVEWKPLVELYNSMITGTKYPRGTIISKSVLYAKICRYGAREGYNVRPPERGGEAELCRNILKYSMLLRILGQMGVVEPEGGRERSQPKLPEGTKWFEDIKQFLTEMGYSEWQAALFLLGVLVGEIGVEQYKKGDGKKSVLDKINFDGMSSERVKILANYVLEGLRNYRVLDSRTEEVFAHMKGLLDKNIEMLRNPVDNVFYILSGYAYITLRHILGGGKGYGEEPAE